MSLCSGTSYTLRRPKDLRTTAPALRICAYRGQRQIEEEPPWELSRKSLGGSKLAGERTVWVPKKSHQSGYCLPGLMEYKQNGQAKGNVERFESVFGAF